MSNSIGEFSFRELVDNYIFLKNNLLANSLEQFFEWEELCNGVLLYCYNDHLTGLGFEVLTIGQLADGKLKLGEAKVEFSLQLSFADIVEEEALVLPHNLPVWERFANKIASVELQHSVSEDVLATRSVVNLDVCRRDGYPDEVLVYLSKEDLVESCQVRLEGIEKMFLVGTLLQEPSAIFGLHEGDSLSFYNVKNEQGIMCLAIFQ